MVSRNSRYGRLPVWIASLTLLAVTDCAMVPADETAEGTADEAERVEAADDSAMQPDETPSGGRGEPRMDAAGEEAQDDSELQPDDTLSDDLDDRLDDIPVRMPADVAPPVNDPRTSPGDECLSPIDACCQSAISLVRRLELRGIRFTDDAGGELIRNTVAEFPACFVGFVFADNQTCSLETGLCEDIQGRRRTP